MLYDRVDTQSVRDERFALLNGELLSATAEFSAPFEKGMYVFDGWAIYAVSSAFTTEQYDRRQFKNYKKIDIQLPPKGR